MRGLETNPQAKTSKSGHAILFSFFRRVRATSMTQRRVENTRVHFWTFSPVSVNIESSSIFPYQFVFSGVVRARLRPAYFEVEWQTSV